MAPTDPVSLNGDEPTLDTQSLFAIMFPNANMRQAEMLSSKRRFVHYTSAEAAVKIIRTKTVWLRNVRVMNDSSEVQHGLECLVDAWGGPCAAGIKSVLEALHPGGLDRFHAFFDGAVWALKHETYIICLSEHIPETEDRLGRLSMWRAYGRSGGVALVMNTAPFFGDSDALKAYTTPVAYFSKDEFAAEIERLSNSMVENISQLKKLNESHFHHLVFSAFRFALLSAKHPGFREEREWRVVHNPTLDKSEKVQIEIEIVNGIPQPVCKIRLENDSSVGLLGLELNELLDRVIIGPTAYPGPMFTAFCTLLREAGVSEPESRVFVSTIPVR
ncbi:DUF2971 domain-containing protein [Falsiroseomonas ponticola]|uniref:DUF2971 domain-containing protein n=1 Tax=Falsiroseomonas ponticola TaxID=2786951 RepID=UPI001933AF2C|nr:DUF2971 domain-containing protein [Roseomonas ponticola]